MHFYEWGQHNHILFAPVWDNPIHDNLIFDSQALKRGDGAIRYDKVVFVGVLKVPRKERHLSL